MKADFVLSYAAYERPKEGHINLALCYAIHPVALPEIWHWAIRLSPSLEGVHGCRHQNIFGILLCYRSFTIFLNFWIGVCEPQTSHGLRHSAVFFCLDSRQWNRNRKRNKSCLKYCYLRWRSAWLKLKLIARPIIERIERRWQLPRNNCQYLCIFILNFIHHSGSIDRKQ